MGQHGVPHSRLLSRRHGVECTKKITAFTDIIAWGLFILFISKGEKMEYTLNVKDLESQVIEVRQFEHNVTGVRAIFTAEDLHEDIIDLIPSLLLSFGEEITGENGLSYITTIESTGILWDIREECTRKAGTFFAQYAFSDANGNIKAYSGKFTFKVLPSVDIQKAVFENRPRFVEAFRSEIEEKIADSVPTKVSELENDSGYLTSASLAEYAKSEEVGAALKAYAKTSELNDTLELYATQEEVSKTLGEYATKDELSDTLGAYSTTEEVNEILTSYAKPADITSAVNEYKTSIKPVSAFSSKLPSSAATTALSNATLTPDSNSIYTKSFFLNKRSGSSFAFKEFSIVFTSPTSAKANANVEIYINASSATSLATAKKLYTVENVLHSGSGYVTYIHAKFHNNVCILTYTKYASSLSLTPIETQSVVLNLRVAAAASFYFQFVPVDDSVSENFTSGTKIEIIGNA